MKNLTICVGLKNRTFFLVKCLIESAKNCVGNEKLEFSIFDCCSDDVNDVHGVIKENWPGVLHFKQEKIEFSRSYCFNRAVENSKTDYVFLCDADMVLPINFIDQFFLNVSMEKTWFPICFSLLKGRKFSNDETKDGWWRDSGYGMVGISKKVYTSLGGLNESFSVWGGEDNDFYNRVKTKRVRSKCIGLFHNWHCSRYNVRTTPERFKRQLNKLDIQRPKYVLAITTFNRIEYLKKCIETWLETNNTYAEWTLIVSDDGSTDGTLQYLEKLNILFRKVIIKNQRRGIHYQVNQIIKYLENNCFDVCFKCDDDVEFLLPEWDNAYFLAIKKTKYEHLVFYDQRWIGRKHEIGKHRIVNDCLISLVDAKNVQGAFYTITPKIIKTVGYFDLNKFGLCGLGHIDYTARCCRAGFNNINNIFDIKDSNKYLKLITKNYIESPNEFRYVENTPELLKIKKQTMLDNNRIYIGYNEINRSLISDRGKVIYLLPNNKINENVIGIVKYAKELKQKGYNVFLLSTNEKESHYVVWIENSIPIFSINSIARHMLNNVDTIVVIYWETIEKAMSIQSKNKIYFVQPGRDLKKEIQNVQTYLKEKMSLNIKIVQGSIGLDLFYKTNYSKLLLTL